MEKRLFGVLEWIANEGGTIHQFSHGVMYGVIHELRYRYFISEGWIGLKTPSCPSGKSEEYKTFASFKKAVTRNKKQSPNSK